MYLLSLHRTYLLPPPHLSLLDAAPLLSFTLLSPPNPPGVERPSTWTLPPPASLHRSYLRFPPLPASTCFPGPSYPMESCYTCLWIPFPLSVHPPFANLFLRPGPCQPLGVLPYEGPSLPMPASVAPPPPPLPASTGGLVPFRSRGVCVMLFVCP